MNGYKIIEYSMVGNSHVETKRNCEDVIQTFQDKDFAILVLADGAGSAKNAHRGATIATSCCIRFLKKHFERLYQSPKNNMRLMVHNVIKTIKYNAHKNKQAFESYSSTLLFIAIRNDKYICGHIGDGVIGAIIEDKAHVLSDPERGEFANNTYFTTSPHVSRHSRYYKGEISNISSFFMMSDGSADCLFNSVEKTFAPAVEKLSNALKQTNYNQVVDVNNILKDLMENHFRTHTNDDCSFAMIQW